MNNMNDEVVDRYKEMEVMIEKKIKRVKEEIKKETGYIREN